MKYHDYSGNAIWRNMKAETEPGDYLWTGVYWTQRGEIGFVTVLYRNQTENMRRLCRWCERPLIICVCNPVADRRLTDYTDYEETIEDFLAMTGRM